MYPYFTRETERRDSQGAMLILAMILMSLLWFGILIFSTSTLAALKSSNNYLASERATTAAEAGLMFGLTSLKANTKWRPSKEPYKLKYSSEKFSLEVFESGKSPVSIPTGTYLVRSTGMARSGKTRLMESVVKMGESKNGLFDYALFGESIDTSGGVRVEAFDARTGAGVKGGASIASNSSGAGSIRLNSAVYVDGTAWVSKTADVTSSTNFPGVTWGTANAVWKNWSAYTTGEKNLSAPLDMPSPSIPAGSKSDPKINVNWQGAELSPGNYQELKASGGGVARLKKGTYVFDSVQITGGATLAGAGSEPVVIMVRDKLQISNGTLSNSSQIPRNLIFVLADGASVNITGGSGMYAVIYGPKADVQITGGARFYGAVVGKEVKLSGGPQFFYDTSLKADPPQLPGVTSSGGGGAGGVSIVSTRRY